MKRASWVPSNWREILVWIGLIVLSGALSWLQGELTGNNVVPPPPVPVFDLLPLGSQLDSDNSHAEVLRGAELRGDPGAMGLLPHDGLTPPNVRPFGQTPAGRASPLPQQGEDDPDVYLWQAAVLVLGQPLPARAQGRVGSCVGFGTTCALEHLSLLQVALGRAEQFKEQSQESLYAICRVNVGHIRGGGDGAMGVWAAEAAKQYGVVARGANVGGVDLSRYDEGRCRQWGASGVPAAVLAIAKEHPCQDYARCDSAADCRAALRAGYPIAVSSGQGFVSHRDANGFAQARGSWSHCMAIIGYRGDRKGFFIENSWGPKWIDGPNYPQGATAPPEGGFWAEWAAVDRMCRARETFAFSDLVGFPAQNPWLVHATRRRPNFYARLQLQAGTRAEWN